MTLPVWFGKLTCSRLEEDFGAVVSSEGVGADNPGSQEIYFVLEI
ncbi:hypothetical protein SynBIOSU31_00255 [Synechococcus sp. BIOS-U3-1]|nr:hypothetical protein SynBIOSU31_00255 [Synechococcus sp. BIOS-U3-1]